MALFYRVKSKTSETKMKACKQTLTEISIYGTAVSTESQAHLAECHCCTAAFQEAAELEGFLTTPPELEAPMHLKYAILAAARSQQKHAFFPALGFAFKVAAVLIIMVSGFWLGLQMANGNADTKTGDFDVASVGAYKMNTAPNDPANLGEVYFAVLQEE